MTRVRETWTYRLTRTAIRTAARMVRAATGASDRSLAALWIAGGAVSTNTAAFLASRWLPFIGESIVGDWLGSPVVLGWTVTLAVLGVALTRFTSATGLGLGVTCAAGVVGCGAPVLAMALPTIVAAVLVLLGLEKLLRWAFESKKTL